MPSKFTEECHRSSQKSAIEVRRRVPSKFTKECHRSSQKRSVPWNLRGAMQYAWNEIYWLMLWLQPCSAECMQVLCPVDGAVEYHGYQLTCIDSANCDICISQTLHITMLDAARALIIWKKWPINQLPINNLLQINKTILSYTQTYFTLSLKFSTNTLRI